MINSVKYKRNEGIREIMTLKEAIRYKTARKRKTPAAEIVSKKRQDVRTFIPECIIRGGISDVF
jgi:hypothetical protein